MRRVNLDFRKSFTRTIRRTHHRFRILALEMRRLATGPLANRTCDLMRIAAGHVNHYADLFHCGRLDENVNLCGLYRTHKINMLSAYNA